MDGGRLGGADLLGILILMAHAILISPHRLPDAEGYPSDHPGKSRIQGQMGNIVEWQSLRVQEYRFRLMIAISKFWEWFGVRRPCDSNPQLPRVILRKRWKSRV